MSLEWPLDVLQEVVLKDGIRALDCLSARIFQNKLKMVSVMTANQISEFCLWAPILEAH